MLSEAEIHDLWDRWGEHGGRGRNPRAYRRLSRLQNEAVKSDHRIQKLWTAQKTHSTPSYMVPASQPPVVTRSPLWDITRGMVREQLGSAVERVSDKGIQRRANRMMRRLINADPVAWMQALQAEGIESGVVELADDTDEAYEAAGLDPALVRKVADYLMRHPEMERAYEERARQIVELLDHQLEQAEQAYTLLESHAPQLRGHRDDYDPFEQIGVILAVYDSYYS